VCSSGTCIDGTPYSDPCTRASQDGSACTGGICHAGSCCTGCLSGGACAPGTTRTACGWGGQPCENCGPVLDGFFCDSSSDPGHPFCNAQ
jgi:hypothetical protein